MADTNSISDLIDRIKAEGQLTRNTGTNSIKVTNMLLLGIKDSAEQTLALLTGQTTILKDFVNDAAINARLAALGNQGAGAGGAGAGGGPNPANGGQESGRPNVGFLAGLGATALGGLVGMFKGWINAIKLFSPKKIVTLIEEALLGIKKGIMFIIEPFAKTGKAIIAIAKDVLGFGKTIGRIGTYFSDLFRIVKGVSGIVGKLFFPLTIIMTGFDTIKGIIDGYAEGGIIGALEGAITGFFNSLVFGPLDLIKDAVAWVLEQLGFENAAKTLESFSFSQIFTDLIGGTFELIGNVFTAIKTLFSNIMQATIDAFDFVGSFTTKLVGGIFDIVGNVFDAITTYFYEVVEGFKSGGVWGGLGAILEGYFQLMVMKPLDLLKDLVSWAASLFGFENASAWLDSFSFSEMFTSVVDWISAIPGKIVEFFEDMWVDAKGKLLSGLAAVAAWVGGLGDRIYLNILEYLKGTRVGGYLVDEEMITNARKAVGANNAAANEMQSQIMLSSEAEKKALQESRVQRHAQEVAAKAGGGGATNIDARSGGNTNATNTTATQVTNYYANQGTSLDGAYLPF